MTVLSAATAIPSLAFKYWPSVGAAEELKSRTAATLSNEANLDISLTLVLLGIQSIRRTTSAVGQYLIVSIKHTGPSIMGKAMMKIVFWILATVELAQGGSCRASVKTMLTCKSPNFKAQIFLVET